MQVLTSVWDFFQAQILGMKWLQQLIGSILNAMGLDISGTIGGSILFFLYDTIKIMVLLSVLIFIISYIQSYFPPERTKRILGRFHGIGANILAALLGTVTPFCSCSSIPLFIGFTSAGLPLGMTFSFLISSPLVDLGSLVLLMSIFGLKVAIAYVLLGLVLAVACGTLIGRLKAEKYIEPFVLSAGRVEGTIPEMTKGGQGFLRMGTGLLHCKKGDFVRICRCSHRRAYPQLDSREFYSKDSWQRKSILRSSCHTSRRTHVCRYLWYHPHCGGTFRKGSRPWHHSVVHDGSHCPFPALHHSFKTRCETETAGAVRWNCHGWNHTHRVPV